MQSINIYQSRANRRLHRGLNDNATQNEFIIIYKAILQTFREKDEKPFSMNVIIKIEKGQRYMQTVNELV